MEELQVKGSGSVICDLVIVSAGILLHHCHHHSGAERKSELL